MFGHKGNAPRVSPLSGRKKMDAIWILIAMPLVGLIFFVCLIGRTGNTHPP